ncbi:MAG TPA: acyl-ACP--UDP-N-acetylglucosamine O-acyltransferase [Candidatus Marinimicrobia bacterium]|nr:acyl-ACP--UDP-N-acetylglucosamine O-acyltransferase [Candidatus Neomarinimicrobiota bacterium]
MSNIHPTNIIADSAKVGKNVTIGAYNVIEDNVILGDNVTIGNFNTIGEYTEIDNESKIFHNSSIGVEPQDKKFGGEKTKLMVGKRTVIREFVTLNRGTKATGETVIGDDVLIMTGVHVAHDCIVGNNVILVNLVALGGHVEIDDWAILGGASTVHQFCKIGKHVMLAANSKIVQDVPPYILAGKHPLRYAGINALGLSRRGFSKEEKSLIKKVYKYYFRSELNTSISLKKIKEEFQDNEHVNEIVNFIENSDRGII